MGIFLNNCTICGKSFHWFSGSIHQICDDCINEMGGIHTVYYEVKDDNDEIVESSYIFMERNKYETEQDVINELVNKGLKENCITIVNYN